jgi:hypothetical protein
MTSKYKIKIVCGFRQDQVYTIDGNEAHKAYYLFNNPEFRTVFSDGLAIQGKDIQRIVPDYHATMGWNATHKLDGDDMNYLHATGVLGKLNKIMSYAKEIARMAGPEEINTPLLQLVRGKYARLTAPSAFANQVLTAHHGAKD